MTDHYQDILTWLQEQNYPENITSLFCYPGFTWNTIFEDLILEGYQLSNPLILPLIEQELKMNQTSLLFGIHNYCKPDYSQLKALLTGGTLSFWSWCKKLAENYYMDQLKPFMQSCPYLLDEDDIKEALADQMDPEDERSCNLQKAVIAMTKGAKRVEIPIPKEKPWNLPRAQQEWRSANSFQKGKILTALLKVITPEDFDLLLTDKNVQPDTLKFYLKQIATLQENYDQEITNTKDLLQTPYLDPAIIQLLIPFLKKGDQQSLFLTLFETWVNWVNIPQTDQQKLIDAMNSFIEDGSEEKVLIKLMPKVLKKLGKESERHFHQQFFRYIPEKTELRQQLAPLLPALDINGLLYELIVIPGKSDHYHYNYLMKIKERYNLTIANLVSFIFSNKDNVSPAIINRRVRPFLEKHPEGFKQGLAQTDAMIIEHYVPILWKRFGNKVIPALLELVASKGSAKGLFWALGYVFESHLKGFDLLSTLLTHPKPAARKAAIKMIAIMFKRDSRTLPLFQKHRDIEKTKGVLKVLEEQIGWLVS